MDNVIVSHSKTDTFGRKAFDELQLGTSFVSRQFSYHTGEVTETAAEDACKLEHAISDESFEAIKKHVQAFEK